jgi:ribose transport system ATP-binding protein
MTTTAPAIEVAHITKRFAGACALDDVSFAVEHGEIHALLGENGAGKSTMMNVIAGVLQPDGGEVRIDGDAMRLTSPAVAHQHGVRLIPQQVDACPGLSVGRNVLLGLERPTARRATLSEQERERVEEAFRVAGAHLDASALVEDLTVADIRLAQIAKALVAPGKIMLCDEPTAVLSENDAEALLDRLVNIRDQAGGAIVYISHRLTEVLRIADRITVLRDGCCVGTFARAEVDRDRIIALMAKPGLTRTSHPARARRDAGGRGAGATGALAVEHLSSGRDVSDVSLEVRSGQVVGVAGLQGAGHGVLLSCIAGRQAARSGTVTVDGRVIASGDVVAATRARIGLVPADRRQAGIVPTLSVRENIALPRVASLTGPLGFRRRAAERRAAMDFAESLDIRGAGIEALAGELSGGNQQKVALARVIGFGPRFLLLEEPTQGIDVRAKAEIRALMLRLAREEGLGVLVASSEFEDLIGFADEIHVMRLGRQVARVAGDVEYAELLHHALP